MVRAKASPSKSNMLKTLQAKKDLIKVPPTIANTSLIKKKKAKPGSKVLKHIRLLQKTTNLLIPKSPFIRIVSDLSFDWF